MLFHNSRDLQYRAPQGAVPCGSAVTLRARSSIADARVLLRTWWAFAYLSSDPSFYRFYVCLYQCRTYP